MTQKESQKADRKEDKGMAEIYALGAFSVVSGFVGEWIGAFVGGGIGHPSFDQGVGQGALPIGAVLTIVFLFAYRNKEVVEIRRIGKFFLWGFIALLVINLTFKALNIWGLFNTPTLAALWRDIVWAFLFGALLISVVLTAICWALIGWRSR